MAKVNQASSRPPGSVAALAAPAQRHRRSAPQGSVGRRARRAWAARARSAGPGPMKAGEDIMLRGSDDGPAALWMPTAWRRPGLSGTSCSRSRVASPGSAAYDGTLLAACSSCVVRLSVSCSWSPGTAPHDPAMISQPVTVELAGDPLAKQVADLRVRLAEAETTIDAIHEFSLGYVDLDEGPVRGGCRRHQRHGEATCSGAGGGWGDDVASVV